MHGWDILHEEAWTRLTSETEHAEVESSHRLLLSQQKNLTTVTWIAMRTDKL